MTGNVGLTDLTKLYLAGNHMVVCNNAFVALLARLHSLKMCDIYEWPALVSPKF